MTRRPSWGPGNRHVCLSRRNSWGNPAGTMDKGKFSLPQGGCQILFNRVPPAILYSAGTGFFVIISLLKETVMRIVLGSDHAGFDMKQQLVEYVRKLGNEVLDVGTHDRSSVDYPDFAEAVGKAVMDREADRGILICGSGVGSVIAANKIPGIRAGICHDCYSAHQGVEHDDMNVLVLGARVIGIALAEDIVRQFLGARFSGDARFRRRLEKVEALEKRHLHN
jgi:ribose 5-phosphate isomerase B